MPSFTAERSLQGGEFVRAHVELREDHPTLSDGFSVTGELYERHGTWSGAAQYRNGRDMDAAGCIHDEVLRAFPHLAPIVALHLSDPDGVPMHADANGWYFYSGENDAYELRHYGAEYLERMGTGYERACRTLRVDSIPEGLDREAFTAFVDAQRPRWAQEAADARALIGTLRGGVVA